MSYVDRVREFDERIRELCAQVVRAEGMEFQEALLELANALELWQSTKDDGGNERAARAS